MRELAYVALFGTLYWFYDTSGLFVFARRVFKKRRAEREGEDRERASVDVVETKSSDAEIRESIDEAVKDVMSRPTSGPIPPILFPGKGGIGVGNGIPPPIFMR